ncbi:hypothetical protein [Campylobacter gastrosuis]|uniref:Uncharacterized protein n=1 Tax=Campylobacter gastrosuis TaxID=2974576 RepID=A0ABT7HNY4_9BACT|nr:hypothetical protein [Campylobacter gastrosuis]MDL0088510.1 hypothetical protein [Campylobacter gastrosuis]
MATLNNKFNIGEIVITKEFFKNERCKNTISFAEVIAIKLKSDNEISYEVEFVGYKSCFGLSKFEISEDNIYKIDEFDKALDDLKAELKRQLKIFADKRISLCDKEIVIQFFTNKESLRAESINDIKTIDEAFAKAKECEFFDNLRIYDFSEMIYEVTKSRYSSNYILWHFTDEYNKKIFKTLNEALEYSKKEIFEVEKGE